MDQILTTYKKRQEDIAVTALRVIRGMENNPAFPDPPPALKELKKQLPEYRSALAKAKGREKLMTSIKDDKKAIILQLLQELIDYVTATCNGDRTMMLSSGFDVTSENGKGKQPPTIERLEVELGAAGIASIRVRNVTNAIAFMHQYTPDPPTPQTIWISEGSAVGRYTFRGLNSEKRCWFRVVAIGHHGKCYSEVVSKVIQ